MGNLVACAINATLIASDHPNYTPGTYPSLIPVLKVFHTLGQWRDFGERTIILEGMMQETHPQLISHFVTAPFLNGSWRSSGIFPFSPGLLIFAVGYSLSYLLYSSAFCRILVFFDRENGL